MQNYTKLSVYFGAKDQQEALEAIHRLPKHAHDTFSEHKPGAWCGHIQVSCPVAPELADGDLTTNLAPYFPVLWEMKHWLEASFELVVFVGTPHPQHFQIEPGMVAMLAALGAGIRIECQQTE